MEPQDEIQDIRIDTLKEIIITRLADLENHLSKEIARTDGKISLMEEKNCRKHQEILETTNKYRGEMYEKMDQMKERMFTKDDYDMFLVSNNGKLRMMDDRITKVEKSTSKIVMYLTAIAGTAVLVWQFGQQLIVEFLKKKL